MASRSEYNANGYNKDGYTRRQQEKLDKLHGQSIAYRGKLRGKYFSWRHSTLSDHYLDRNSHAGQFRGGSFLGLFSALALLLLVLAVFRLLHNGDVISLQSFFSKVVSAPSIPTNWLHIFDTSFGDSFPWALAWLGKIFDFFSDLFSFAMFISVAALNALSFILFFLRWLFL